MKDMSDHFQTMAWIMVISGFLSTMNVWADSLHHVRFSVNDVYMVTLMTGWMLTIMGLYYRYFVGLSVGILLVASSLYAIRTQLFVSETEFLRGMIPHHSMAIHMSKRMREKPNTIPSLLDEIITSQEKEILYMNQKLRVGNKFNNRES